MAWEATIVVVKDLKKQRDEFARRISSMKTMLCGLRRTYSARRGTNESRDRVFL
jgi:hypothetical protein